ncbi:hypothetical protein B0A55_08654 [Friedmanniomyces simplex]|uniref:Bacteriophage T5 Orf172 DNA-binding domain-containing protein n=1 Tax=Friedmanniomyces simplex TaxID=329884 RepID=A0A4U0X465_9PEZI|nr:hypothetical protein B0A55_08654 [Friedmanniomyces simplex]
MAGIQFEVTLEPTVHPAGSRIQRTLSEFAAPDSEVFRQCQWTNEDLPWNQTCLKLAVDINLAGFWSSLGLDFERKQLSREETRALLQLVCCKEHVEEWLGYVKMITLVRQTSAGQDHGTKPAVPRPASGVNATPICPPYSFGSSGLSGHVFKLLGPSPHLSPIGESLEEETASLESVSNAWSLEIFAGGRKKLVNASNPDGITSGDLKSSSAPAAKGVFGTPENAAAPTGKEATPQELQTAARLSLSPDQQRHSGRRNLSVSSHSRPSSPGNLSAYGKLAWATMKGDVSFDRKVVVNAEKVARLLLDWKGFTNSRTLGEKGCVYIVRAPELDLVKIGYTQLPIGKRLKTIGSQCKTITSDWKIIESNGAVPLLAFKLLEKLVQTDLAPHRWYFDCVCGLSRAKKVPGYTQHQEWFEVTDQVALDTLQMWRKFLLREPFTWRDGHDNKPELQEKWRARLTELEAPSDDEMHDEHEMRLARWRKVLEDAESDVEDFSTDRDEAEASGDEASADIDDSADTDAGTDVSDVPIKPEAGLEDLESLAQIPPFLAADIPAPSIEVVPSSPLDAAFLPRRDRKNGALDAASQPTPAQSGTPLTSSKQEETVVDDACWEDASSTEESLSQHDPNEARGTTEQHEPEKQQAAPTTDGATAAISITDNKHANFDPLIQTLNSFLTQERPAIPERTILEDLVSLRWPLACMVAFALHVPYVPAGLSMAMWTVFLPFFLRELRGWY